MPTDYNLPPDWEAMTAEELDRWFKQERARRQAMRQDTPFARNVRKLEERMERRVEARNTAYLGR
jgi:hypothetical protein